LPSHTAKIKAALAGLPLEYREGPSTSGLVAILRGGGDNGRAVLLRGDMDALPMQEETGLPFAPRCPAPCTPAATIPTARCWSAPPARSAPGARSCRERSSSCFQPGEEGYHGARFMMEDGLLDDVLPRPRPTRLSRSHLAEHAARRQSGRAPGRCLAPPIR
jgi:hippurate hydrolase